MGIERNWAGNLTYRAARVEHPSTLDDLRALLAQGGAVRMLESRHCFNDVADTDGVLIGLDQLPPVFEVSPARDSVRVAGGMRYGDIAPLLEAEGLALSNLASLPHISVAGAVATGTHGSGDVIGSLASAVRALTIVTPAGETRALHRGDADFDGTVVSLGALGAVVDVTLDVEPTYAIAQHVFEHPDWDSILAGLDEVTGVGTSVSIFSTWQRTDIADQIWVKQRLPEAHEAARESLFERLGAEPATSKRHPILGVDPIACTEQQGVGGPWFERLPHFKLDFTPSAGAEIQSEYLVPRADAVAAIQAVRTLAGQIAPLLLVNEIRTVKADDLWLSSSYGTDAVGLHFTWKPEEAAVRALLPTIEAALPATARPHWGKVFALDPAEVRSRYPRWDDFAALARRFDPERRLVNPYLERLGL
ncbi:MULTISPECIES: D-arabinono-1,4-lactone oxidase [unclassified Microbacterium]|uniref:D-arabinono-1,4-lactone oxidase n=1 Tax=unclassified Microbacterium TaxID=2609290 RepID=UPI000EA83FDA|nr:MULTISPECIES: D-arabinono-1,4-lactone oxidase [unclassified Microbacterium]MBT2483661.1 FAD-binding protein [Microbacterium sp. ISL-108]RKN66663.1 FAD-binding protein [Microbacterium sp. CGR2]